jgi:hypothetical protein
LVLAAAWMLGGCSSAPTTTYVRRTTTVPPNTLSLSTMVNDLAVQKGFIDQMMAALGQPSKTGAAVLSPKLLHAMRVEIAHRDGQALEHFPGWGMGDIDPAVDLSGAADRSVAEGPARPLSAYVDLGDYALDHEQRIDLDRPSTLPGFSAHGLVAPLGEDAVHGDGANPAIAAMHGESARLAEVLNRLAMNGHAGNRLEGAAPATATLNGHAVSTPEDLLRALLATGHEVTVADARTFANFGHLHYEGMDVMMPFWVNTQVYVPGSDRQLLVPVAQAEYEWFVRGPKIDADVAFYFGIDGKAEFRTMDTLDQAWVMGRHAHEYRGADAVEVTRLAGLLALAYAHAHLAHPRLPFGGYYALGVCQDGVAAIEQRMTGRTTLFPNMADAELFRDPRDAEVDAEIDGLIAAIPKDRDGKPPSLDRVFGSLPTTDIAAISVPGLAADLESVETAWHDGKLRYRKRPLWQAPSAQALGVAAFLLLVWVMLRRRHRSRAEAR